jgi:hypothetical protein
MTKRAATAAITEPMEKKTDREVSRWRFLRGRISEANVPSVGMDPCQVRIRKFVRQLSAWRLAVRTPTAVPKRKEAAHKARNVSAKNAKKPNMAEKHNVSLKTVALPQRSDTIKN